MARQVVFAGTFKSANPASTHLWLPGLHGLPPATHRHAPALRGFREKTCVTTVVYCAVLPRGQQNGPTSTGGLIGGHSDTGIGVIATLAMPAAASTITTLMPGGEQEWTSDCGSGGVILPSHPLVLAWELFSTCFRLCLLVLLVNGVAQGVGVGADGGSACSCDRAAALQ